MPYATVDQLLELSRLNQDLGKAVENSFNETNERLAKTIEYIGNLQNDIYEKLGLLGQKTDELTECLESALDIIKQQQIQIQELQNRL